MNLQRPRSLPFILRGVSLLGVDSVNCPMALRRRVWERLATDMRPKHLAQLTRTIAVRRPARGLRRLHRGASEGTRRRRHERLRADERGSARSGVRQGGARPPASTTSESRTGEGGEAWPATSTGVPPRSIEDREGFWREQAALIDWHSPFERVLDYQPAAVREVVRRRRDQPLPQRRRPPPRGARRPEGAGLHLHRDRPEALVHLSRAARGGEPLRGDDAVRSASARATACSSTCR